MADASAAACSSSVAGYASTSDSQYHDVFINHRGPDVKETFATPLYCSLTGKGLQVFLDKPEMQVGQYILSQIEAAIRVASVHIAIFSPRYAESEWCLNELLSMAKTGNTIIPVFYKVKPEHLRRTKWTGTEKDGPYAIALRKYEHEQRHGTETIQRWRETLKDVANISGLELEAFNGDQNKLLDKLVQIVLQKFPKPLKVGKYPTGLKEKLEELERTVLSQLQGERREGAKVVGIVGLGGVGKSTLAKYFFNRNTSNYKGSSFLSDVRENAAQNNISSLQSKLIKDLKHPASDIKIERCEEGADKLKNNLSSCHALVILDNVDDVNHLDAFLPIKDVLNSNSLILVTTRDESVLTRSGILKSSIYHLTGLNRRYSQQLFCCHAFSQRHPLPGFKILVDGFIKACKGLPLSLKVFGALLCGKNDIENDIDYWKELLDGINKPLADIENTLRISYDSLNKEEQQIFLDIACFCIGEDRDRWLRIWGGSGWIGLAGFRNLESKCLVEVDSENRIRMHDHLRDMGRKIADSSESMERRLWHPLKNLQEIQSSTEITQVRGIRMTNCNIQRSTADIQWSSTEVLGLKKLQLLEAVGIDVQRILEPVQPSNLIWLRWRDCQDAFLPSWVPLDHLRVLHLESRTLKTLWAHESPAPLQLRELIISAPLVKFPKSIGKLKHLEKLVAFLPHLTALPDDFDLPSLTYLKISSNKLQTLWQSDFQAPLQLRELNIRAPLVKFPKSIEQLKHLEKLVACLPHLTALPDDFDLPSLKYLKISSNKLQTLWQSDFQTPRQLRELVIDAPLVEFPKSLGQLVRLEKLVAKSTNLTTLPKDFHFPSLKYLKIESKKMERLWQSDYQAPLQLRELIIRAPLVEFPESLNQLEYLEKLVARNTSIATLPENFDLPSLKYLHLRSKELQRLWQCESQVPLQLRVLILDALHVEFPKSLSQLKHLELLAVNGIPLRPDFGYLPSLKYLHSLEVLPNFLWNLTNLQRLELDYCSGLKTLPNSLGNLTNLQHLELGTCSSLEMLPDSLCKLTNLQHIDLNGCFRLEMLPDFLGTLTSLQHIDLSWCENLKTLPDSFVNLTNLQHLNLDGCIRLEILPNSFGNQLQLQHLSLKGCSSLTIYSETLGNFTKLKSLDLSCKTLKIPPNPFGNLLQLEHLHLQGCSSLTMSSETLGNMSKLKCLDLSCCLDKELLPPESEESNDEEEFEEEEFEELMELYNIEESEEGYNGEGSEEDVESEGEESEEGYNAEEIEEAMEVDHGHEYEELTEVDYEGFIFVSFLS